MARPRMVWTTADVAGAAEAGGRPVTAEYIRQLCKAGVIRAERPARDWLIIEEEARRFLEAWLAGVVFSKSPQDD